MGGPVAYMGATRSPATTTPVSTEGNIDQAACRATERLAANQPMLKQARNAAVLNVVPNGASKARAMDALNTKAVNATAAFSCGGPLTSAAGSILAGRLQKVVGKR